MDEWDELFSGALPKPPKKRPRWMEDLFHPVGTLPVNEIHQSWLSTYRECGMKALLYTQVIDRAKTPYYMFGGSVFHQAMDEAIHHPDLNKWVNWSRDPNYWDEVFEKVWLRNPKDTYQEFDYGKFRRNLVNPDTLYGLTLGQIIYFAIKLLNSAGFEILGCEVKLNLQIPGGTPFVGTLDLLLWNSSTGKVIADTKSSGFWQRYFKGKSLTKQSYSEDQIKNHLQLTHYDWMGQRKGLWSESEIGRYMIFTPVNLTKYSKGEKRGRFRGEPYFFGTPVKGNTTRYESDLKVWLDMARAGHFARMYPSMFGKLNCPTCPFSSTCLEDKTSGFVPDYIKEINNG